MSDYTKMDQLKTQVFASGDEAEAAGYAQFNRVPHLAVDVPDGYLTITAKMSDGRRITFAFLPYREGAPPSCVDVVYHDSGTHRLVNDNPLPTFDAVVFGGACRDLFHTRSPMLEGHDKPGIVCILMDNHDEQA